MKEHTLLKIGEFARLAQVSIATLHHYDQYDLLKPSTIDPDTNYRYYTIEQLPRLHRIVTLKDLGFPLSQITQLLEENLSLEILQGMFRLKQAQIQQTIITEQARLLRIATRLHQIEQEGTMPKYDILLKQVDPLLVASIRETISISTPLLSGFKKIYAYLDERNIPYTYPDLLLRHSRFKLDDHGTYADLEFAVPLRAPLPTNDIIRSRILPSHLMASAIHSGNLLFIGQAHVALSLWLQENRYQIAGPPRQLHIQSAQHSSLALTELQFPIVKLDENAN